MATPWAQIDEARKHVGYVEGAKKDNMFGRWYGLNHTAWCAMFVSYVLNHGGAGDEIKGIQTPKGYHRVSAGINWFKGKGRWHAVSDARPGDLAFFDWQRDGDPDHTGLVVKNDRVNKRVLCIEGNTGSTSLSNGGKVKESWRSYGVLIGVGRPRYDRPELRRGDKGAWVKTLQTELGGLVVDGNFGPLTEAAVNKFKTTNNMTADGVVGRLTWHALLD